jgi:biotin transport system permease protein
VSRTLRRVPTGVRLLVLTGVSGASALITDLRVLAAIIGVGMLLLVVARPTWRGLLRPAVGWVVLTGAVVAAHLLSHDPEQAWLAATRLTALVTWATAVATLTTTDELMSAVVSATLPLRPLGARPASLALVLGLTVRFVPELEAVWARRREAHLARGARLRVTTTVAPMVVEALDRSHALAEAVVARSFFDRDDR